MLERKTENLKGALLMVLSMAAFTTNDLFVKLLGAQLPLSQILMLRGAVALLMIAGLCCGTDSSNPCVLIYNGEWGRTQRDCFRHNSS